MYLLRHLAQHPIQFQIHRCWVRHQGSIALAISSHRTLPIIHQHYLQTTGTVPRGNETMTTHRSISESRAEMLLLPCLAPPSEFLALSASLLLPRTCLPPAVPRQLKPTHSVCYGGPLTLLSPVMVPTKHTGQRSRALTRLRKSRSEGLSRSALDSWYSAPQISRAFRVGSPSCTFTEEAEREGPETTPKSHVLAGRGRVVGGPAGAGRGGEAWMARGGEAWMARLQGTRLTWKQLV